MSYGVELVLDLHDCDESRFDKAHIEPYLQKLCEKIDMQRADLHWWDDADYPPEEQETSPHTHGCSVVQILVTTQFILTSSIVIHSLPKLKKIYINIFSCKDFDARVAEDYTRKCFDGTVVQSLFITRK